MLNFFCSRFCRNQKYCEYQRVKRYHSRSRRRYRVCLSTQTCSLKTTLPVQLKTLKKRNTKAPARLAVIGAPISGEKPDAERSPKPSPSRPICNSAGNRRAPKHAGALSKRELKRSCSGGLSVVMN